MSDVLSSDRGGTTQKSTSGAVRRYDLDWLRVGAVLLLVYFHAAAVFYVGDLGEFYVTDERPNQGMIYFIQFVHQWHMPLFFLVSGAGTWFALQTRTGKQHVAERVQRLFIPFLFGTLVLIPPQVYFHRLNTLSYHNSYIQFYPQFFNGIRPNGNFEWGHLWFLIYLFTFSLLALPLFLYLKQREDWRVALQSWLEKPTAILFMALPLMMIEATLRPRWPGFQNLYNDWANFALYLLYFIYGYVLCSSQQLGQTIGKHWQPILGMAIASMSLLFSVWVTNVLPERGYSPGYVAYQLVRGVNSWLWVMAFLGLAQTYLNFKNRLLAYLNEASYPLYLLHQTVLVAIAFYIIRWSISVPAKFLIIGTASLGISLGLYELLIKRIKGLRFLFGLKL